MTIEEFTLDFNQDVRDEIKMLVEQLKKEGKSNFQIKNIIKNIYYKNTDTSRTESLINQKSMIQDMLEAKISQKMIQKSMINWSKIYKRDFKFTRDSVYFSSSNPLNFRKNSLVEVYYDKVTNDILEVEPKMTREALNQFMEDGSLVELMNTGINDVLTMNTTQEQIEPMIGNNKPQTTESFLEKNALPIGIGVLVLGFLAYKKFKK